MLIGLGTKKKIVAATSITNIYLFIKNLNVYIEMGLTKCWGNG